MRRNWIALACTILLAPSAMADESRATVAFNPDAMPDPFKNRFSHGVLVQPGAQWLFTAGQTGRDKDGRIGDGIEEQADLAMHNLRAILRYAGMDSEDVVKMTIYYIDPEHLAIIVAARNRYFGEDFRPASTAVGVSALANPKYLVEVELVAAAMPQYE